MKLVYSLLLVVSAFASNAQIAGYFGKRCVIGYSNYFMIAPKGPGPLNANPADEASPTLNNVHCLNLEYVYKERKMVCVSGQYLLTGVAYSNGTTNGTFFGEMFGNEDQYPYPGGYKYAGNFSKPALLRSFNLSLGIKTFKKGFIPPVGRYRKLEVLMFFEKIKYDYQNFAHADPNDYDLTVKGSLGKGEYSYKNVAFACTFGYQRILNDKISLDYGIRFAYTPALNIITIAAGDEYTTNVTAYFRRESNLRIAREQLINVHLGIGFLAF